MLLLRIRRLWCTTALILLAVLALTVPAAASDDAPDPLIEAVHHALDAWSQFTTTGDLAAIDDLFAANGPQRRQFEAEAAAWQGPMGVESLRLELLEIRLRRLDATEAAVWVEVEASRRGFVSEVFAWDFDLIHESGRWRVWTVVQADERLASAQAPATSPTVTATNTTSVPVVHVPAPEPRAGVDRTADAAGGSPHGTRLPALSAWIIVITVIGVALAGYMAPRMDRRGER